MPTYAEWRDHFSRVPAAKRRKVRGALDTLMADSWFTKHYGSDFRALKQAIKEA